MKRLHTIKVDDDEWSKWKAAAASECTSLSQWIRGRCNTEKLTLMIQGPIGDTQVVERTEEVPKPYFVQSERDNELSPSWEIPGYKESLNRSGRKPCKHGMLFCKKCK